MLIQVGICNFQLSKMLNFCKCLFFNNRKPARNRPLNFSSLSVGHSRCHVGGPMNWDLA